jgi:pentapeptide repeat protein
MANDEHVALLKQGVAAWNVWRDENPNIRPDLTAKGAELFGADLSEANLCGADLCSASLGKANLTRADLRGAYLAGAYLG